MFRVRHRWNPSSKSGQKRGGLEAVLHLYILKMAMGTSHQVVQMKSVFYWNVYVCAGASEFSRNHAIHLSEVCNPNSVLTAALTLWPLDFLSIITSNRNQTIIHRCVRSGSHNFDLTFTGSSHKNLGTEITTVAGKKDRFRKRSSFSQEEFLARRECSINSHCCQGTTAPLTHLRLSLTLWVHMEFCLSFENSHS